MFTIFIDQALTEEIVGKKNPILNIKLTFNKNTTGEDFSKGKNHSLDECLTKSKIVFGCSHL